MKKKSLTESEVFQKLFKNMYSMILESKADKVLYGNCYWEISDRKIELIDPTKIKYIKKGIIHIISTPNGVGKLHGKSLIKPKRKKNGKN